MSNRTYSWHGKWVDGPIYLPNDIVEVNAITYLCLEKHRALSTNEPGVDDPANNWAHYWEEDVFSTATNTEKGQGARLELVPGRVTREDPFYYKETNIAGNYYVCIDEGNDTALVIFKDALDIVDARKLTNRLNNAVYRWLMKKG